MDINVEHLVGKKNILAFSHGVDSTALFHKLIELDVDFDLAMVNYNYREQSKQEAQSAINLSKTQHKTLHLLELDEAVSSDENTARNIRHNYFRELIKAHNYDNLVTGHNLNDRLEWFFMQVTKGAGIRELIGMRGFDRFNNENASYHIIRPFIETSRDEIYQYLHDNRLDYFEDVTNKDDCYLRNKFRHEYVNALVKQYREGLARSFKYLEKDSSKLPSPKNIRTNIDDLELHIIVDEDADLTMDHIGTIFKRFFNRVLSTSQRLEVLRSNWNSMIGDVRIERNSINGVDYVYVFNSLESSDLQPHHRNKPLNKHLKTLKIPNKLRHAICAIEMIGNDEIESVIALRNRLMED